MSGWSTVKAGQWQMKCNGDGYVDTDVDQTTRQKREEEEK